MKIEDIAKVCHEANRAYCASIGDKSQLAWESSPNWQIQSAISGVKFHLENPGAGPSGSHENWMREKVANGWKFGSEKDSGRKLHPCIVQYAELPHSQQIKDALFVSIVHALKPALG